MIKAIIFDLNGIFIRSRKLSERFEKDFNISKDVFVPELSNIMNEVRKPHAGPAFQYWKNAFEKWKIQLSELEFWDYWFKVETLSESMVALARSLKERGVKIFILSNNFKERSEYYSRFPWMRDVVDAVYFSWQTGFIKPDVRAWELVLKDHNLKPKDCIYFDDQQKNLDAAESVGIKSYLFTDESSLEKIINDHLNDKI